MRRLAKHEGYGNVLFEEVPLPAIGDDQVLVRTHTSLISRGSEILRRYRLDGPVDPGIMGYSVAGTVVATGETARQAGYADGDRVFVSAPHAEYVVGKVDETGWYLRRLPEGMSWERAPFLSLARGGVAWAVASRAQPTDTVVVLGQGLVGNLVMQAHRARGVARLITVDPLAYRVRLSARLGADVALDSGQVDAVAEVRRLTDGKGADVVVDCVGGPPGVQSFQDALEMVQSHGIIHLIGLYQGQPLLLDSGKIQRKMLIGGYHVFEPARDLGDLAVDLVHSGRMQVEPLITHRFPADQAPQAFKLLDERIDEAFGVLLQWPR
jgi:L-iditol 2-dehydrogenase